MPKFAKKRSFRKGGFHANPNIGWEMLVILAAISIITSLAYGFNVYMKISRELEAPSLPGQAREKLVDKERVGRILEYFAEKENRTRQIIAAPARVSDPSR